MPHQVLASRYARRNGEGDFTLVRDHAIHSPALVRGLEAVFPDLEPLESGHCRLCCIGHLRTENNVQGEA